MPTEETNTSVKILVTEQIWPERIKGNDTKCPFDCMLFITINLNMIQVSIGCPIGIYIFLVYVTTYNIGNGIINCHIYPMLKNGVLGPSTYDF